MRFNILILFTIFFALSLGESYGQKMEVDSLITVSQTGPKKEKVKALIQLGRKFGRNEPDSALGYAHQAVDLMEGKGFESELISAYNLISSIYRDQGQFEEAEVWFQKLFAIASRQQNNRALARYYLNKGIMYRRQGELEKAVDFYEKSIPYYEKDQDFKGIGRTAISLGNILLDMGKKEQAQKHTAVAINMARQATDSIGLGSAYGSMGFIHLSSGELFQSLEYFLKSIEIKEKIGDKRGMAISYLNLGEVELALKRYDETRESYLQGLKLFEEIKFSYGIIATLINLGSLEQKAENFAQSEAYFLRGHEMAQQVGDDYSSAYATCNLGILHTQKGAFKKAKSYLEESLQAFTDMKDIEQQAVCLDALAALYLKEGNAAQAIKLSGEALQLAQEASIPERIQEANKTLFEAHQLQGNIDRALQHHIAYANTKDSILDIETSRQLTEIRTLYETEKKERKIELLEKEKEIENEKLKVERSRRNMLIGGILFLAIIATLLLNRQRLKIQKNRQLRERDSQIHAQKEELMQLELEASQKELALKKERLDAFTQRLLEKNEMLHNMEQELKEVKTQNETDENLRLQKINTLNKSRILTPEDWEQFRSLFDEVYPQFFVKLQEQYTNLSKAEKRLLALIKLGLDNRRVGEMLAISYSSVRMSRYRLTKKLELDQSQKLEGFAASL